MSESFLHSLRAATDDRRPCPGGRPARRTPPPPHPAAGAPSPRPPNPARSRCRRLLSNVPSLNSKAALTKTTSVPTQLDDSPRQPRPPHPRRRRRPLGQPPPRRRHPRKHPRGRPQKPTSMRTSPTPSTATSRKPLPSSRSDGHNGGDGARHRIARNRIGLRVVGVGVPAPQDTDFAILDWQARSRRAGVPARSASRSRRLLDGRCRSRWNSPRRAASRPRRSSPARATAS